MANIRIVRVEAGDSWTFRTARDCVHRGVPPWLARVDLSRRTAGTVGDDDAARREAVELGKRLTALLPGSTRRWLGTLRSRSGELVLEARGGDAGPLLLLPWELLWTSDAGAPGTTGFLVQDGNLVLTRRLAGRRRGEPGRGLVVHVSSPSALPALDRHETRRRLALAAPNSTMVFTQDGTIDALADACRDGPGLVYLGGHGDGEELLLEAADGAALAADADTLLALLPTRPTLYLSACHGGAREDLRDPGSLALRLYERGLPAVFAYTGRVPDALAIAADAVVVAALARGATCAEALQAGRIRLSEPFTDGLRSLRCPMAWSLLVLYGVPAPLTLGEGPQGPSIGPPTPPGWSQRARRDGLRDAPRLGFLGVAGSAEHLARALLSSVSPAYVELDATTGALPALPDEGVAVLVTGLEGWLDDGHPDLAWRSERHAAYVRALLQPDRPLLLVSSVRAPVAVDWEVVPLPDEALVLAWSSTLPLVGRIRDPGARRRLVRACGALPGLLLRLDGDARAAGLANSGAIDRALWELAEDRRGERVSGVARRIGALSDPARRLLARCLCLIAPVPEEVIDALGPGRADLVDRALLVASGGGWSRAPFLEDAAARAGLSVDPQAHTILAGPVERLAAADPTNAVLGYAAVRHAVGCASWDQGAARAQELLLLHRLVGDDPGTVGLLHELLRYAWPRHRRFDLLLELHRALDDARNPQAAQVLEEAALLADHDDQQLDVLLARAQLPNAPLRLAEQAVALARRLRGSADHPDVVACETAVAFTLLHQGELTRAEDAFRSLHARVVALDISPLRMLSGLGNALHAQGRHPEALVVYEAAVVEGVSIYGRPFHPELLEEQTGLAEVEVELGRSAEAERRLRAVLDVPVLPRGGRAAAAISTARRVLGSLFDEAGRHEEAEAIYRRLLADPASETERSDALTLLGHALTNQGRHAEAIDAYEAALSSDVASGDARGQVVTLLSLGAAREALGEIDAAEALLRRAIAIPGPGGADADTLDARLALAELLLDHGREGEAEVLLRELVADEKSAHPTVGNALRTLAQHRLLEDRDEEALDCLNRAVPLVGGLDLAITLQIQASTFWRLGRLLEAEAACREALSIFETFHREADHTDHALAWYDLVGILVDLTRFDEAEEAMERALRLAEDLGGDHLAMTRTRLAELRVAQGREDEAVAHYAALAASENDGAIRAHSFECIGALLARGGHHDRALEMLRAAHVLRTAQDDFDPERMADLEAEIASLSRQPPEHCGRLGRRLLR